MARSSLLNPSEDLLSDSGAVLWSIIRGEQLEYPVTLSFLVNAIGYEYEAVVMEADTTVDPPIVKVGSTPTTLTTRVPTVSVWSAGGAFSIQQVVSYNGKHYLRLYGIAVIDATPPDASPAWQETTINKVYLQFPSTLGAAWSPQPTLSTPASGFFELRVTEPAGGVFRRTWKPVRGMVEILFSPTEAVP